MSDQYWGRPRKAKVNVGKAWWYAMESGFIEIHVNDNGHRYVTIPARQLRKFLNMLDNHKPRKGAKK